jgi:hypothetical protein
MTVEEARQAVDHPEEWDSHDWCFDYLEVEVGRVLVKELDRVIAELDGYKK